MWPFRKPQPAPAPDAAPDPLDYVGRPPASHRGAIERYNAALSPQPAFPPGVAMDSAPGFKASISEIPDALLGWYAGQRFIGHQTCAMLSQHWLIDKACSMPARDAVRHGFEIQSYGRDADLSNDQQTDIEERLKRADRAYGLRAAMTEFVRMGRVFGVRVAFFKMRGWGPEEYGNPFNLDAVRPGDYEGITQVDPYWCVPQLSGESASDPSGMHFYEPTWWIIRGQRYHRSHLMIFRNGEVPDVLKPMYVYGGVPTPQRIYERVYAAERTANEAPQLAMTKRTLVQSTDLAAFYADPERSAAKLEQFAYYRDNYGVKLVSEDDTVQQFDTTLADLDAAIMTQYQIVAAAAGVPATKLLGTTPKGFQATGEYEAQSYHEELETIQAHDLTAFVNRHHQIVMRSDIEPALALAPGTVRVEIEWNPVDSTTAAEEATINKTNADTDAVLLSTGAIDAMDIRNRLRADNGSGYTDLPEMTDPGTGGLGDLTELLGGEANSPAIPEA